MNLSDHDLDRRLLSYAARVVKLVECLPSTRAGTHVAGQLLRAGTAPVTALVWSPEGRRLAVVTASGGQAELVLDVASEHGLELPPLPPESRKEAERVIGAITGDGNPLDAWGNGDYATNLPHALKVLDQTPTADVIVGAARVTAPAADVFF